MTRKVLAVSRKTFSSLRIRNYRIFATGQLISLIGTWMQTVGQSWLVLKLTGDAFPVGVVNALQFTPMLIGGLWGGVIADRFDKRRTLIAAQSAMAVVAATLAVLTATGSVRLWMVYGLAFLLGCANVVEMPTRQAFVVEMVGPADTANAVGLNSAIFNSARIIGPTIAGLIIVGVGIWPCFAINTISFVAVIVGLSMMRTDELHRRPPVPRSSGQVREVLRYINSTAELRSTILLMAIVGTFTLNYSVTLPLLAKFTFHGNAASYGLFTSVMGVGSLIGALTAAARGRTSPRLLVGSSVGLGMAMLTVAVAPSVATVLPALFLLGLVSMVFLTTANSGLQLTTSDALRGRVMALYAVVFVGTTPIGAPLLGWVASTWGARVPFVIGGLAALVGAAVGRPALESVRRTVPVDGGVTNEPALSLS